jgi:hypothetical protein
LLVSNDLIEAGEFVRVANVNNFVYIIYANGVNLRYRRFNILTPATLESAVTIATNVDTTAPKIDAASGPGKIIVVYNSSVGVAKLRGFGINSNGTLTSIIGVTGADPSEALDIVLDSADRAIISYSDGTNAYYTIFPFNLGTALLASTIIEAAADVTAISSIETTTNTYRFYYEISAVGASNYLVRTNTGTLLGVVGTPNVYLRSVGLAAKVFTIESDVYVPIAFQSTIQDTYFITDASGIVVAKISGGVGGGHVTSNVLPHMPIINDTQILFPSQIKSRTESESGVFFSPFGVLGTILDFAPADPYSNALLGENLHIAGGILQMYDGDSVVEHGFHVYPEDIAAGATVTTGGNMSAGNYGYIAVYRWTDNGGQDHYSAESEVLTVVIGGGSITQTQEVIVPTLRLTEKSNVVIEVYRTEDNGTVFYQVTSITNPTFNNEAVDTITFTDTVSDADLISRKPLYTTGGVLENIAAPATSAIAVHTASDRIIIKAGANLLQYSKQRSQGLPVEFNDELVIPIDPIGGDIVAFATMDEKIIILEQDACFYIGGTGPNNLGQQDTFTAPERIPGDIGCIEPRSIVAVPDGLMFKSRKGIFLLNRGLELQYIGSKVEEYNSLTITSAKTIGELNQVRFTTSDGDCVVYNYNLGLWGTFTNHRALSAEIIGNDYYYIRSDFELFKENRDSFSDNGVPIKLYIETAWMNFNIFQGFQRVRKCMVVGDYKSQHLLRFRVGYNYNEAFVQERLFDPMQYFIDTTPYGEYSPYGEPVDFPYGGVGRPYQARFDFQQQKCQALKFIIEDEQDVAGEGLSLSGITFEVAGKDGLFKIDGVGKFGVS